MSKLWWILLGIVLAIVIFVVGAWLVYGWFYRAQSDVTPYNKNLQFVGTDKLDYLYGKTLVNADGTMLVASAIHTGSVFFKTRQFVSLIKLDKDAKQLWEKKIPFYKKSMIDFIPIISRKLSPSQIVMVRELAFSKGQYKVLVSRSANPVNDIFIISFDADGKLLDKKQVKLDLAWGASLRAISVKEWFYICYIDRINKLLCLAKTNQNSGEIAFNAMKSFKQDSLMVNAVAPDSTGEVISIAAYDSKKGTSFFRYDKLNDLKEYFRTEPKTRIWSFQKLDGKLMGGIKDDSLLVISDITDTGKPLLNVSYQPAYKDFTPVAVQIIDGNYYACINFTNPDKAGFGKDVMVYRFNPKGEKTGECLIQGKRIDYALQMLVTPTKELYVFGNSLSVKLDKGYRIFASKVKM